MAQQTVTYVPRPIPTLDPSSINSYLSMELAGISQSVKTIIAEITKINDILTRHGLS